jgi:hypothetical protein
MHITPWTCSICKTGWAPKGVQSIQSSQGPVLDRSEHLPLYRCWHKRSKHPDINPPKTFTSHTQFLSPKVELYVCISHTVFLGSNTTTARLCQEDGTFLQELSVPSVSSENDQPIHDWTPFKDRLAYDWAHYHYISLQSSAAEIAEGLNLWSATAFKHGSSTGAPWKTVKDMYETIDAIQTGSLPFKTHHLFYKGPKLSTPPCWMEEVCHGRVVFICF